MLSGSSALTEDRCIVSLWDFNNNGLVAACCREILFNPLPKHRSVDPDDVVDPGIVVRRAAENVVSHLVLVDLLDRFVENSTAEIEE